ncbi:MAG: ABC transporter permease [Bacteroidaceae bacterium]|nr:ABC transporter permease [Bacteroidaceae bacterium]MBR6196992.1 ABC transporter permease [Bacteroidaceae bacterium]
MSKKSSHLVGTQFVTTTISTTLVLVMLGTIVLFMLTARNLSNYVRENITVQVLISDDLNNEQISKLQKQFKKAKYVKSIDYVSREDAVKEVSEEMGTDPTEFLGYNPFTASFEIKVNAEYGNPDSLRHVAYDIKKNQAVVDVTYPKDFVKSLNENIQKVSIILLIIAALFSYISFALINNTVRLTIFSRRFIINTMKLVGASWGFIRRPFLKQGMVLGLTSAVIADAVIFLGVNRVQAFEPALASIIDMEVFAIVSAAVFAFGIIITLVCIYASLNKFLRMSSNDLYYV